MKKTLSLILALLMTASCASAIFADDTAIADEAADVEATAAIDEEAPVEEATEEATPYDRAIRFLNTYGIMKGMEDGLLHAEKAVERYQMALFTGRISTGWVEDDSWEDFDANDSGFADLKGTAAENVYGAMSYVSQKGIIEGYPDGTFKPEKVVTYREALTMAVRTLGYQGLEFPWGYIEKAVALGLTDGITDVAYTDVINRGVAAQIIYNAMFADNSKLALKNFNVAFGWADAIITSTVINDTTVDKDGNSVRANYADEKYVTPVGYVAFQLVEKDGTLGKDVYYATADSLGLGKGHADELALGAPYSILFAKDGDDNLVDIVDYEAYAANVVKNEGRTDNEGVAYETVDNIGAYLKDYTLVDKYSSKVLTNSGKLANELIVKSAGELKKTVINYGKTPFAFDWTTGDILEATKDKDGKYIVKKDKDGKDVKDANGNPVYAEYTVKYHYDKEFDRYFEIKTKADVDGTEKVVGISILDDSDVAELKKAIDKACTEEKVVGQRYVAANVGGIYATLNAYAVSSEKANYATYEAYDYAKIGQKDDGFYCAKCDKKYAALTINGTAKDLLESADCGADKHADGIWWQDEYAPVLDEDGKIEDAYVIYGYNTVTKELKVIKTIEAYSDKLTDADTYYATGVLRGYSISKGYVVIGETKYYFNEDFGSFDIDKDNKNYKDGAYKAYLSNKFDGLFNQFVRFYLLDGKVVEIETVGASDKNYLVVESYAGISSDGYIVVNGYSTDDLKLSRYRIASYDGWDEGDFFWYGNQITTEFVKGNVYKITSYDADNDLYYVSVLGKVSRGDNEGLYIDTDAKTATITITKGYREYSDSEKNTSTKKVSSSDKYIIIGEAKASAINYMPIAVFEGKAQDGWTITGQLLVGDKDSKTFIFVNAYAEGFNFDSWKNAGIVMVLDYKVLEKFYDGANANEGEWYLNGATEYGEVLAYNFFTGKFEDVTTSTNLKPKKGHIYQTIDGVLSQEYKDATFFEIFVAMGETYYDWKVEDGQPMATETSDYVFELNVPVVADYFGDDAKKEFSKAEVSYVLDVNNKANDLVNSLKFVKIVNDKNGNVAGIEAYGKDEWKADVKAGLESIYGHAVYAIRDDGTVDVVVYIDPTTMTGSEVVKEDVTATTSNVIGIQEDAGIAATVKADKVEETVNGVVSDKYVVKSLTFDFVGSCPDKDNHATILQHGLFWDAEGKCDLNDWCVYVNQERVYGQDIKTSTYAYTKDCEAYDESYKCALIKTFEAAVAGIEVAEGEEVRVDVFVSGLNTELTLTLSINAKGNLVVEFNEAIEQVLFGTVADVVASVK
ncbi:MAG: S-layer homology domain-containing protein [Eubacteriales bacterium]|nr:S-layer homology domain-containing protein [Eubacteriales bacterium]